MVYVFGRKAFLCHRILLNLSLCFVIDAAGLSVPPAHLHQPTEDPAPVQPGK